MPPATGGAENPARACRHRDCNPNNRGGREESDRVGLQRPTHPAAPEAAASTASMLGLAGFIVWPLLPITLAMLVSHALRAEKNLNRYLYDYD